MAMFLKTEKRSFILLLTRTKPLFSVFSFRCDSEIGRPVHNIFPNTPAQPDSHTSPLALQVNTHQVHDITRQHGFGNVCAEKTRGSPQTAKRVLHAKY